MFKTIVIIRHSKSGMNNWNEGSQVVFNIESDRHIDDSKKYELAEAYLKATNISYREVMCEIEVVN